MDFSTRDVNNSASIGLIFFPSNTWDFIIASHNLSAASVRPRSSNIQTYHGPYHHLNQKSILTHSDNYLGSAQGAETHRPYNGFRPSILVERPTMPPQFVMENYGSNPIIPTTFDFLLCVILCYLRGLVQPPVHAPGWLRILSAVLVLPQLYVFATPGYIQTDGQRLVLHVISPRWRRSFCVAPPLPSELQRHMCSKVYPYIYVCCLR